MDNGKILVVDDEAVIRELLSEVLADEGYAVESAESGPRALDILGASDEFVLLFTDIMMPEMDGLDLIRRARRLRPAIIPIVMTAYATLDSARSAVKEGAYEYVLKPFSLSEVKLAVSNALERYRLASENARLLSLTQLFNISERIATMRDEKALLDFVLEAALDRVDAERGSIMVLSEDGNSLDIKASVGVPEEALLHPGPMNNSIAGMVAREARPLLVEDMNAQPEVAGLSRRLKDSSFISVPLERKGGQADKRNVGPGGKVTAVLNVSQKRKGVPFSEGDLKTLSIVANHAAAALENVRLIRDIERSHLSTIESMALLLEARDPYTRFHSQRVRDVSVAIALRMGVSREEIDVLRIAATLHDIGKVGVPDGVLNKPGRLDEDEWEMIRRHPRIGFEVLEPVHFLKTGLLDIVHYHHERVDGTGYPGKLKESQIPPLVRIIGVADSYDAMASSRAYRKAMQRDDIIAEFIRCSGTQFDPDIATIFIEMLRADEVPPATC